MKRKPFFLFGSILTVIIFIMVYSNFWYELGKYSTLTGLGSFIFSILYILILAFITIYQYKSIYHEKNKSILSTVLYGIPLLLLVIFLIIDNDSSFTNNIFPYFLISIWSVNFLNYFISIFAKE